MRDVDIPLLEDMLSEESLSPLDLERTLGVVRPDGAFDAEDDLGLRALYENPELVVPPSHWPDAA